MNSSQKAFLLGLLGVAIAALTIIYVAKPNVETMKSIKGENEALAARLAELQQKEARRDEYIAETERFQQEFDEILNAFPADLNQEISIMFVQGIKDDNDFEVNSLGLGQKEQFYTLGLNGGDVALEGEAPAEGEETAPAEGEAASAEGEALVEGESGPSSNYECYRASFPVSYMGSYDALKDVVYYVDNYSDRMVVDTIDIAYNADADRYSGSMNFMCYAIESEDRPERTIELNEVEIGVDNIFNGGDSTGGSSSSSLNKYDENDGAALISNYDFYAMLNPPTSDVSAKVVGQNGTGKEASVITNSDNTVSTLTYEFYEKDGKNYCKYTLDNSTSYEAEVTSAEDIKLLITSSARKDDTDKAGVKVTIKNSTSLPVYVKVNDEDATSPRVEIASKTGAVKVYK